MDDNGIDDRHGGPFDRGRADAYYGRLPRPHKFEGGTYQSKEITDLTEKEKKEYMYGYESQDDRKQWD